MRFSMIEGEKSSDHFNKNCYVQRPAICKSVQSSTRVGTPHFEQVLSKSTQTLKEVVGLGGLGEGGKLTLKFLCVVSEDCDTCMIMCSGLEVLISIMTRCKLFIKGMIVRWL